MRQDFIYHLPIVIAQKRSNRKQKKAILTGAMVTALLLQAWLTGAAIFGAIVLTNVVQKRRKV